MIAARLRARTAAGAIVAATACLAVALTAGAGLARRPAASSRAPAGPSINSGARTWPRRSPTPHTRAGDIALRCAHRAASTAIAPTTRSGRPACVKAMLLVTYLDSAPRARPRADRARHLGAGADDPRLGQRRRPASSSTRSARRAARAGTAGGHDRLRHQPRLGRDAASPHATRRDSSCTSTTTSSLVIAPTRCDLLRSIAPADRWGIGELPLAGVEAVLQGRLGLRDRIGGPSGRPARARLRAGLTRGVDDVRRLAPLRQGDGEGDLRAAAAGVPDREKVARRPGGRRIAAAWSSGNRSAGARSWLTCSAPTRAARKLLLVGCIHGNECAGLRDPLGADAPPSPAGGAVVAGARDEP